MIMEYGFEEREKEKCIINTFDKEDINSKNTKEIIEQSIEYAISKSYTIKPGAIFSHKNKQCNAIGAVLLKYQLEYLITDHFDPNFLSIICKTLNVDKYWLYRFIFGFDYGNELTFTYYGVVNDTTIKDKVSIYGNKLRKKYCEY